MKTLASTVLILAVTAGTVRAQVEMSQAVSDEKPVSYYVEALTFADQDSGKSRIDMFVQVGFDNLTFVKNGVQYDASYELILTLSDSVNAIVAEQSWIEEIKGLPFEATIAAGSARISQRSFAVAPGKYAASILLRDNESKVARTIQRPFIVPSFSRQPFALSSIMLIARMTVQGEKTTIVPSVNSNMGIVAGDFHIFFEAYDNGPPDSITFHASVIGPKEEVLLASDTLLLVKKGSNEVFMTIRHEHLGIGDYRLVIQAQHPGGSGGILAGTARQFAIRWRGLPSDVNSLDLAIEQLRYISKGSELDSLRDAPTLAERQRRFLAFWKKRDTNPNTPRNERMEEYYARVEYANKHFSRYRDGWKTDMGMIYIVLGPPDNVERHPFDSDAKPYEIWSYYEINQNLVFVDENGFGDYRLLTPLWDIYSYPRQNQ